ncbi:thiamine pyrophosphate-dependent enzyme [Microbacterium sp. ET2]|uniref:thiamine pyrophosphate-dependent enzyme n=1 Tax=Microbacterium albipurpureum TaxID=3050384 RepID=UPI00259C7CA2|nr:thiamine pyrophosphate-dependent enzyme [Microbacterium sp. ET2 (Ac-2212)]WJL94279.1 thiamine pyrophosphate-dependent enzyme [Microbacterium sp. ET2 (Ac-2212)]
MSLFRALTQASRPLIVTTYLGRRHSAVPRLVDLAERLGIPVVEYNAEVLSFPRDHPLHAGDDPHPFLAEADVILAIDIVVPWVDVLGRPTSDAAVFVVNEDPLQESLPLWYVPAGRFVRADAETVLRQLLDRCAPAPDEAARTRTAASRRMLSEMRDAVDRQADSDLAASRLTPASVARVLSGLLDDDAVVVNEAISNAPTIWRHLPRRRPGTLYGNRGTALGWSGGGALGIKLAEPDATVVSIVGDGTFFFSAPASTYWMAEHYGLAVLTVVLDNGGWNATKRNLERLHPDGTAARTDRLWVNLQQSTDFGGVAAAAGGAWSGTVADFDQLEGVLREGLRHVEAGTPAVVTVHLVPISAQPEDAADPHRHHHHIPMERAAP